MKGLEKYHLCPSGCYEHIPLRRWLMNDRNAVLTVGGGCPRSGASRAGGGPLALPSHRGLGRQHMDGGVRHKHSDPSKYLMML